VRPALPLLWVALGCRGDEPVDPTVDTSTTPPAPVELAWTAEHQDEVWPFPSDQHHANPSVRPDGTYAVFFDDEGGPNAHQILASIYDGAHTPVVDPAVVDTPPYAPSRPDAVPSDTGWYVTWHSQVDIWLGEVDGQGVLINGPVQVNDPSVGDAPGKGTPDIAKLSTGDLVITWQFGYPGATPEGRYWVRRFDAALTPLDAEQEIATSDLGSSPSSVAALPDGGFVVAWTDRDGEDRIKLSWFDRDGAEVHTEQANAISEAFDTSRANVSTNADGVVAVAWRSQTDTGQGAGAFGRVFHPDHRPRTEPILLEESANRTQVSMHEQVIVFTWEGMPGAVGKSRAFDLDGAPLTDPIEICTVSGIHNRTAASLRPIDGGRSALFTLDADDGGLRKVWRCAWLLTELDAR